MTEQTGGSVVCAECRLPLFKHPHMPGWWHDAAEPDTITAYCKGRPIQPVTADGTHGPLTWSAEGKPTHTMTFTEAPAGTIEGVSWENVEQHPLDPPTLYSTRKDWAGYARVEDAAREAHRKGQPVVAVSTNDVIRIMRIIGNEFGHVSTEEIL